MSISAWRQIQRENYTDWKKLLSDLELSQDESIVLEKSKFPLNVPKRLVQKMAKGNWDDPLLLQFLPTQEELKASPLFILDPVADGNARKTPKLLHKYHGRALL